MITEREIKYLVPSTRLLVVKQQLAEVFGYDTEFPESRIYSLYFDSLDLRSYFEKVNGDYTKTKYRIRWYANPLNNPLSDTFTVAQVKRSRGTRRVKQSIPIPSARDRFLSVEPDNPALADMWYKFYEMDANCPHGLIPTCTVSYQRNRFQGPAGTSICLDTQIEASGYNPTLFLNPPDQQLNVNVLELKGNFDSIPNLFDQVVQAGCVHTAFSKYSACISMALNVSGASTYSS